MKEKKIDIENQTFYSRKFISMKELNEHWASNKEIIKCIINHMYEALKIFLDNEFDLDKKYYPDDLTIENRIRFIPNAIFRNELNKKVKKQLPKANPELIQKANTKTKKEK